MHFHQSKQSSKLLYLGTPIMWGRFIRPRNGEKTTQLIKKNLQKIGHSTLFFFFLIPWIQLLANNMKNNIEDKHGFVQTKWSQPYLFSFFVKVTGINWKKIKLWFILLFVKILCCHITFPRKEYMNLIK